MDFIVLTSCTQRKRSGLGEPLVASTLRFGGYNNVAIEWLSLASDRAKRLAASQLYVGRTVTETQLASQFLKAPLYFVSTGFGLVANNTQLPGYDLTVARGPNGVSTVIDDPQFSPYKWWQALNRAKGDEFPIRRLLSANSSATVLVALSRPYLSMIVDELSELDETATKRLRIFTSTDGARVLSEQLRRCWLPYDERFDGLASPNPGTRSDFPQRVLRHYSLNILNRSNSNLEVERALVEVLMSQHSVRQQPSRVQKSDVELIQIILSQWDQAHGQATKMLRVLRDDLLISCEQKRFAGLFRTARQQRQAIHIGAT